MAKAKAKLKFDYQRATSDLIQLLTKTCDELIEEFYDDARKYLTQRAKNDIEIDHATLQMGETNIRAAVAFKGYALLESFGKGSQMDMDNPYLDEYMQSDLWNPLRTGPTIVGRSAGEYTDFFGNKAYSTGNKAGQPVESEHGRVRSRKPSYSIQNAEKWFLDSNGKVERKLDLVMDEFIDRMDKYFIYG